MYPDEGRTRVIRNVDLKLGSSKQGKARLKIIFFVTILGGNLLPEYSNHLNTGQVRHLNGPNVSDCQMRGLKNGQKMSVAAS